MKNRRKQIFLVGENDFVFGHGSGLYQGCVHVGTAVAVELPGLAYFGDHVQIDVRGEHFVLIADSLREDAAARIAEVAGAIEFADIPRSLDAHSIDGGDEITIGHGVRGLFQLPEVFAQPGYGGRRVEDDLGAVQAERARALREMAVVADVDADLGKAEVEDRNAEVAGAEIKFLPETGSNVRNMSFAVLAEERTVVVDDGGGVVIDAFLFHLVNRNHQGDMQLARQILH